MNSRERVIAALAHRQPDRIPIDFGGTATSGMHVSCVAALRDRLQERGASLTLISEDGEAAVYHAVLRRSE